jgi:hypothetical protein
MNESEQHRRECEARQWLAWGYTTPAKIDELRKRITAKRGEAAAERLIQDMWEQRQK